MPEVGKREGDAWSAGKLINPSGISSTSPIFTPLSERENREGNMLPIAFPFHQLSGSRDNPALGDLPGQPQGQTQSGRHPQLSVRLLQPAMGLSEFSAYPSTLPMHCCQAL